MKVIDSAEEFGENDEHDSEGGNAFTLAHDAGESDRNGNASHFSDPVPLHRAATPSIEGAPVPISSSRKSSVPRHISPSLPKCEPTLKKEHNEDKGENAETNKEEEEEEEVIQSHCRSKRRKTDSEIENSLRQTLQGTPRHHAQAIHGNAHAQESSTVFSRSTSAPDTTPPRASFGHGGVFQTPLSSPTAPIPRASLSSGDSATHDPLAPVVAAAAAVEEGRCPASAMMTLADLANAALLQSFTPATAYFSPTSVVDSTRITAEARPAQISNSGSSITPPNACPVSIVSSGIAPQFPSAYIHHIECVSADPPVDNGIVKKGDEGILKQRPEQPNDPVDNLDDVAGSSGDAGDSNVGEENQQTPVCPGSEGNALAIPAPLLTSDNQGPPAGVAQSPRYLAKTASSPTLPLEATPGTAIATNSTNSMISSPSAPVQDKPTPSESLSTTVNTDSLRTSLLQPPILPMVCGDVESYYAPLTRSGTSSPAPLPRADSRVSLSSTPKHPSVSKAAFCTLMQPLFYVSLTLPSSTPSQVSF